MSKPLTILHLSDIHIPKEYTLDSDFKTIQMNLLKDIEELKKTCGNMDVAVFSGDFIDKGNTQLFTEKVEDFCTKVLYSAGIPKKNAVFVPGNHDATRPTPMVASQIQKVRENGDMTDNKADIGYMGNRFMPFVDFYADFTGNKNSTNQSYGITDIVMDNKEVYRFIRVNSALASCDQNDYNNLFLTRVQLDDILAQKDDSIEPKLTFLVMHHPMDWLTYEERILLEEYITDLTKFNVDIILNGHVHNGQVSLNSDLDSNIITLVSGVGYSRVKRGKSVYPDAYRYAVYRISPNENKLEGRLRISNQKKVFGSDTTLYRKINNDGILFIPLKIDYGLSMRLLELPLGTNIVLNNSLLETLDCVIKNLWSFESYVKEAIDKYSKKRSTRANPITQEDRIKVSLVELCSSFNTILFPKSKEDNTNCIRVHIRHYFPGEKVHRMIMSSFQQGNKSEPVRDMEWGEEKNLIYYSYKAKRALIASINPDKAYYIEKSRWNDFLTVAVSYPDYKYKTIPAMSFGISCDWDNIDEENKKQMINILYCLSYVGLEHVIEHVIRYANDKLHLKEYFNKKTGGYNATEGETSDN